MRYKVKPGVVLADLTPAGWWAIFQACEAHEELNLPRPAYITSARDGDHSPNSKHYTGEAIDLRTRDLTDAQITALVAELRVRLSWHFDVIRERDHIHIEYDPKPPR